MAPAPPPGFERPSGRSSQDEMQEGMMWISFREALYDQDVGLLSELVADTLNAFRSPIVKGTPEWDDIVAGLVEDGPNRDQLLATGRLTPNAVGSSATVEIPQPEGGALLYLYGFASVASGGWRLVEVRTRYSP